MLAVTGLLGTSLLGGLAYAATGDTGTHGVSAIGGATSASVNDRGPGAILANVLQGLVAKGTITQAQSDAVTAAYAAAHPTPPPPPEETYLGLTGAQIRAQREAGKTLGQIADATPGKSRAGLIAALVAAENAHIDQDVASGRLTAAQASERRAQVTARVTERVDTTGPAPKPAGARP